MCNIIHRPAINHTYLSSILPTNPPPAGLLLTHALESGLFLKAKPNQRPATCLGVGFPPPQQQALAALVRSSARSPAHAIRSHTSPSSPAAPPSPGAHLPHATRTPAWRFTPPAFSTEFSWIYKRAGFDLQSLTMVVNLGCDQIRLEHKLAVVLGDKLQPA